MINQCFSTSKLDKADMNFFVERFLNSNTKEEMMKYANVITSFSQVLIINNSIANGGINV